MNELKLNFQKLNYLPVDINKQNSTKIIWYQTKSNKKRGKERFYSLRLLNLQEKCVRLIN